MSKCLICDSLEHLIETEIKAYPGAKTYQEDQPSSGGHKLMPVAGHSKSEADHLEGDFNIGKQKGNGRKQPLEARLKIKNFLTTIISPEVIAMGDPTRQIDAELLVHQCISSTYNMAKIYKENYEKKDILLVVDCSGSCLDIARSSVPAAYWLADHYPHIKVIFADNANPTAIYGANTKPYVKYLKEWNRRELNDSQLWKEFLQALDVKTLVCFSDEHEWAVFLGAQGVCDLTLFTWQAKQDLANEKDYALASQDLYHEQPIHFKYLFTNIPDMQTAARKVRKLPKGVSI